MKSPSWSLPLVDSKKERARHVRTKTPTGVVYCCLRHTRYFHHFQCCGTREQTGPKDHCQSPANEKRGWNGEFNPGCSSDEPNTGFRRVGFDRIDRCPSG